MPTRSDLLTRLTTAAAGLLYPSESEAPFIPLILSAPHDRALTTSDIRQLFTLRADTSVTERPLDDFFRPLIEDTDPADPATQAVVPRARQLRETIRAIAPDARAFRAGTGPEVRYLVVGHVAPTEGPAGTIAGVETIGYES